ncbi:hypothetical protein [Caulobacter sp. DWP3-1-3b2]|uniref:hypothetical protein n=1 Tax=Caulobacter sp. DWP3-1-3b2 TaxID=2804643 RepID=UPI003CE7DAFD
MRVGFAAVELEFLILSLSKDEEFAPDQAILEHRAEKWPPVFRKSDAKTKA